MLTILSLAAAAAAAIAAFSRTPEGAAAAATADSPVVRIRRSTSVVLALAEALWTVLDALILVTGRRVSPVVAGQRGNGGGLVARGMQPVTTAGSDAPVSESP